MDKSKGPCVRCAMCCFAAPCAFSGVDEGGECSYLVVNEDDTTTCTNKAAKAQFVDKGCIFMHPEAKEIYNLHLEFYSVERRCHDLRTRMEV
jgi:hypothetical protein